MPRPVMGRRDRVRVEFSLSPALAEQVYRYARERDLTLSQSGERLLADALSVQNTVNHSTVETAGCRQGPTPVPKPGI
jgi:hypothetical protein